MRRRRRSTTSRSISCSRRSTGSCAAARRSSSRTGSPPWSAPTGSSSWIADGSSRTARTPSSWRAGASTNGCTTGSSRRPPRRSGPRSLSGRSSSAGPGLSCGGAPPPMTYWCDLLIELFPLAGGVEVRRHDGVDEQHDKTAEREQQRRRRSAGRVQLPGAQRGRRRVEDGRERGRDEVEATELRVVLGEVTGLGEGRERGEQSHDRSCHDEPLRRDDETVRVARTPLEPGHEIEERRGETEAEGDPAELRARREAEAAALE